MITACTGILLRLETHPLLFSPGRQNDRAGRVIKRGAGVVGMRLLGGRERVPAHREASRAHCTDVTRDCWPGINFREILMNFPGDADISAPLPLGRMRARGYLTLLNFYRQLTPLRLDRFALGISNPAGRCSWNVNPDNRVLQSETLLATDPLSVFDRLRPSLSFASL